MKWYLCILVILVFISCSWTPIDELPYGESRTATIYQAERSVGSPHLSRLNSSEPAMVFHIPADSIENLDAVCISLSTNNGKTWNQGQAIYLEQR